MRYLLLALGLMSTFVSGCQSPSPTGKSGGTLTAADYRNAKPATQDEEARFLAAGERQNRMAPMHVAASLDPSGLSQNAVQAASRPDMEEMQRLMPAMTAKNRQRTAEFCASQPRIPECVGYKRLLNEARGKGVGY